jgi:hypothetical protein
VTDTNVAELLFDLPSLPMNRGERIRVLKELLQNEEEINQECLDRLMARLLEEIQSEP